MTFMDRRHPLALLLAGVALVAVAALLAPSGPGGIGPTGPDRPYPPSAGPNHINFSALKADDASVAKTPGNYWDTYAIRHSAPEERRLIEGNYSINAATGETLAHRWDGVEVYRHDDVYAYVQPADRIPNEHEREQLERDPAFVYHNGTNAFYRYDSRYGQIAPTNIGRHPTLLEAYTWEADNRTAHHDVPVITYHLTGTRSTAAGAPEPVDGTLRLGVTDGIVYAYDLRVEGDGRSYRYTYVVRPAPFPNHDWLETARAVAGDTATGRTPGDA